MISQMMLSVSSIQFYQSLRMSGSGMLKFVSKGAVSPTNVGIRTFPHQTYGVSKESPDQFKKKHTIVNSNGYLYQHQHAPEFEYRSQNKCKALAEIALGEKEPTTIHHHNHNPYKFHLKKGRMGEFLDKNGWMNTIYVMTGNERSKQARQLNNLDRTIRIKSRHKATEYESNLTYKPKSVHTISHTPQDLMSEKVRIRSRRNQQAIRQVPLSQRKLSDISANEFQIQSVRTKMNQTTKEWCKSLKKSGLGRQFSVMQPRLSKPDGDGLHRGELEEWQRKTCRAKWCYKPNREDPEQIEEIKS